LGFLCFGPGLCLERNGNERKKAKTRRPRIFPGNEREISGGNPRKKPRGRGGLASKTPGTPRGRPQSVENNGVNEWALNGEAFDKPKGWRRVTPPASQALSVKDHTPLVCVERGKGCRESIETRDIAASCRTQGSISDDTHPVDAGNKLPGNAVRSADILVATRHRRGSTAKKQKLAPFFLFFLARPIGPGLKLIANFGKRRQTISICPSIGRRHARGIHRHPIRRKSSDPKDPADLTMALISGGLAAAVDRKKRRPSILNEGARTGRGWSRGPGWLGPTGLGGKRALLAIIGHWAASGQGRGAPGPEGFGLAAPLPQTASGRAAYRRGS